MNHKSITPNPQQPVDRVPAGQLPNALAELDEAALSAEVLSLGQQSICLFMPGGFCSYDGDED